MHNQVQSLGKFIPMSAAADYMGTGSIEVPMFEAEILDCVRRSSVTLQRWKGKPATGHPHRYFEQIGIGSGAFQDPRALAPVATGPQRVERAAFIKAITNQSNLTMFDKEVTEQQGKFAQVIGQDIDDIITGIEMTRADAIWTGNDTSMLTPTTTQYMGALKQITKQGVVAPGASIIDAIKSMVANMVADKVFVARPTAIYLNPVLGDYIDREAKAAHIELKNVQVTAGTSVSAINTQAGILPLIPDVFMPADNATANTYGHGAVPAGYKGYFCAIISEGMIEMPYISGKTQNPNPRLFQLGLVGNLNGQFVAVKFDTLICKGPGYAHATLCVQRP